MDGEQEQALRRETEVFITTYGADGKPATVPVWFLYDLGKVYVATGRDSLKVRKLQGDAWVQLRFHRGSAASLRGMACVRTEQELVRWIAPLLNRKYDGARGSDADMARARSAAIACCWRLRCSRTSSAR
ncbi:MAG: pyridoxamine 5'-phosphate oxidase family protein [Dehalococcoidia bacterium]|nr:pyridoxamine 5'-phosphate oxidase family protein [Dehalococcoidia bacterium]